MIKDVYVTSNADVKYVCIWFLNRDEDLTKPLHGDVFITFNSCLRLDGNPKTLTSLFGVQIMFKTISKHYKSAVNSF